MCHLELFQRLLKRREKEVNRPVSAKTKQPGQIRCAGAHAIMKTLLFAYAKII